MEKRDKRPDQADEKRRKAEEIARLKELQSPEKLEAMSAEQVWQVFHELRVHQIELEMQNEELRRAQVELDAARARYFNLYDLAPVGYVTLSEKGMILEANLTISTMLGVTKSALIQQPFTRFIFKDDQDIYYRQRKKLVETVGLQVCELRMVKMDKVVMWAKLEEVAAQDIYGKSMYRVVISDITESKRVEAEKEALRMQLQESQRMESIGRLAGGIAHEFNNALQAILGNVEMELRREDRNEEDAQCFRDIRSVTLYAADLTQQLLAYARKQAIRPKTIDINEAVTLLTKVLRHVVGEHITLNWIPGCPIGKIKMDPLQLNQIVVNIVSNSRDAIRNNGSITIQTYDTEIDDAYCAAHPGTAPGPYVMLKISDNGCGMDDDTKAHLFEPFYTTRPFGEQPGLGMASVWGIVSQNNGIIDVESAAGVGTKVTVGFPRHEQDDLPLAPTETTGDVVGGTETILIVEDDAQILNCFTAILRARGYRILAANSPAEGASIAQENPGEIHLLITDVIMPDMSGPELAKSLQTRRPDMKCLYMSGYARDTITQHGVLPDQLNFVQKPFTIPEICKAIRKALAM